MPLIYSSISNISFTDCILLSTTLIFIQFMHLNIVLQIISSLKFLLFSIGEKPGSHSMSFQCIISCQPSSFSWEPFSVVRGNIFLLQSSSSLSPSHTIIHSLPSLIIAIITSTTSLYSYFYFLYLLVSVPSCSSFLTGFSAQSSSHANLNHSWINFLKAQVQLAHGKHGLCSLFFFLFQTYKK